MQKVYSRINWENDPSTNTPINEDNLNKMDYALDQIDNRVVQLAGYQDRVAQSEANAKKHADDSKTYSENAKESEDKAKESESKAKEYMEKAFAGTPDGYEKIVDTVRLMDIQTTTDTTLSNSKEGGYRLVSMSGNSIQSAEPTPEYPVEIENVGTYDEESGEYVVPIKMVGKNLVDFKNCTKQVVDASGVVTSNNSMLLTDYIPVSQGEYTISFVLQAGEVYVRVNTYDKNKNFIARAYTSTKNPNTITFGDDVAYVRLNVENTSDGMLSALQLERGDTATEIEEYQETTTYAYLTEPLRATDRVVKVDGVFKVERKIKKWVFDGTEAWGSGFSTTLNKLAFSLKANFNEDRTNGNTVGKGLCNYFVYNSTDSDVANTVRFSFGNANLIWFYPSDFETVDEWKAWLSEKYASGVPLTLEYVTTNITYETLDTASQIALNSLETFDTVTYLSVDTTIQPSEIKGEYGTSQVGAYTLKSLLNSEINAIKIEDAINTMLLIGAE